MYKSSTKSMLDDRSSYVTMCGDRMDKDISLYRSPASFEEKDARADAARGLYEGTGPSACDRSKEYLIYSIYSAEHTCVRARPDQQQLHQRRSLAMPGAMQSMTSSALHALPGVPTAMCAHANALTTTARLIAASASDALPSPVLLRERPSRRTTAAQRTGCSWSRCRARRRAAGGR